MSMQLNFQDEEQIMLILFKVLRSYPVLEEKLKEVAKALDLQDLNKARNLIKECLPR